VEIADPDNGSFYCLFLSAGIYKRVGHRADCQEKIKKILQPLQ
jgi:hypothetical protein